MVIDRDGGPPVELWSSDKLIFEAPNWTLDGRWLVIYLLPTTGGPDVRLTATTKHKDGCEYSPDGEWIYLNTEDFSADPGHAQIARLRPDGSGLEHSRATSG